MNAVLEGDPGFLEDVLRFCPGIVSEEGLKPGWDDLYDSILPQYKNKKEFMHVFHLMLNPERRREHCSRFGLPQIDDQDLFMPEVPLDPAQVRFSDTPGIPRVEPFARGNDLPLAASIRFLADLIHRQNESNVFWSRGFLESKAYGIVKALFDRMEIQRFKNTKDRLFRDHSLSEYNTVLSAYTADEINSAIGLLKDAASMYCPKNYGFGRGEVGEKLANELRAVTFCRNPSLLELSALKLAVEKPPISIKGIPEKLAEEVVWIRENLDMLGKIISQ